MEKIGESLKKNGENFPKEINRIGNFGSGAYRAPIKITYFFQVVLIGPLGPTFFYYKLTYGREKTDKTQLWTPQLQQQLEPTGR